MLTNEQQRWIVWGTKQARDQLHGARKWDERGIAAAVAKVAHLHFVDVAQAALRAADDRSLDTPGAIGNPSAPCWQERKADRPQPSTPWTPGESCEVTGQTLERCRATKRPEDDHVCRTPHELERELANDPRRLEKA